MGFNDIDIKVSGGSDIISTLQTYTTKILKPNIVDGKNVLTQEMLSSKNTKYVIKYVYELLDATLTMPQNVILEFDGGSIKNGTLVGNNTLMLNTNETESVLDNVTLDGTWKESSYDLVEEVVADKAPGDGMGRIILRKDKTFAEQLTQENTIYVVRYDFDLGGEEVTIPENSVLEFDGGSLSNGTIVGNDTDINYVGRGIFNEITLSGTFISELNPLMFGNVYENPINSLRQTHQNAININSSVSYSGIKELNITIDENFTTILINNKVDFCGCIINIQANNTNNKCLFTWENTNPQISLIINKTQFDTLDFSNIENLPNDPGLIITTDQTQWLAREGEHSQIYYRHDVQFSMNKRVSNLPIYTYNTEDSVPVSYYKKVSLGKKYFKNIIFKRLNTTSLVTLVKYTECYNLDIDNIILITPPNSSRNQDQIIRLEQCANIHLSNVKYQNSISQLSSYGYVFDFWGIYKCVIDNIGGVTDWHEFGCQGVNNLIIKNSYIKNFDCHSYCKDLTMYNCQARGCAFQIACGVYGNIIIDSCYADTNLIWGSIGMDCNIIVRNTVLRNENSADSESNCIFYIKRTIFTKEQRTDIDFHTFPQIHVDNLLLDFATDKYFIIYSNSSGQNSFSNEASILFNNIKSKNSLQLSLRRYATIDFNKGAELKIANSDLSNICLQYSRATNLDNLKYLLFEKCTLNGGKIKETWDAFWNRIYQIKYSILFKDCILNNMGLADSGSHNGERILDNCHIYINTTEGALYSSIPTGIFTNCVFYLDDDDSLYVGTSKDFKFINCKRNNSNLNLFYNISSNLSTLLKTNYYMTQRKSTAFCVIDEMLYVSDKSISLGANVRAIGIDTTNNKMIYWTGTAWVDATGQTV